MQAAEKHRDADWVDSAESLLATVVIAVFIITFVVQAFQIPSESMEDTLLIGDYLLVDKLRYGRGDGPVAPLLPYRQVQRGEIIVFKYPIDPTQHFVKRVIGIPGDRVRLVNRRVYVNGLLRQEPYVRHIGLVRIPFRDDFPQLDAPDTGVQADWWLQMRKLVEDGQLIVPAGNYFVMGDNRDDSLDSRYWGFVPRANIVGRPLLIYWSMRDTSPDLPWDPTASDKILHFAHAVSHLFQITRWDRTLRLVN
jgi:signal peptidase I